MSEVHDDAFERGAKGERISLFGIVARARAMTGSRSEHEVPVLVDGEGRRYRLLLVGENPMEQPTLGSLQGKRIRVTGTWRNGVVRIDAPDLEIAQDID